MKLAFILDPIAVGNAVGPTNFFDSITSDPTAVLNSNSDTNQSEVTNFGLFFKMISEFNEYFTLLVGGRIDYVDAEAVDPLFDDAVAFLDQFGAAGEADRLRNLGRAEADIYEELYNYNVSAVYKPTKGSSIYTTYNYAEAMPRGLGGGISVQH